VPQPTAAEPPLPAGFAHEDASCDGVRLHLVAGGPGDGPPVVLLHGFPEFWYGWRAQLEPLAAAGLRVLAPDQRGYNLSDKPRGLAAYRLDRLADDVACLIEAAGVRRAALVGHDWGAIVAWWTALRHPDRVRRLAVLNAPHPLVFRRFVRHDPTQRRRSWYAFFFQLPWLPEWWFRRRDFSVGARSLRGSSRRGTFDDEALARYRHAWGRPGALRAMIDWYRASLRRPPGRVADPRVHVPTLIVWGTRDRFLGREMVEPSLALCDDGRLVELPEATHWLQHEEPERVNRLLLEFLAE